MDALRASTMLLLVPVHAASLLAINGHDGRLGTGDLLAGPRLPAAPLLRDVGLLPRPAALPQRAAGNGAEPDDPDRRTTGYRAGDAGSAADLDDPGDRVAITGDGEVSSGSPFVFEPSFLWFLWYLLIIDAVAIAAYLLAPGMLSSAAARVRAGSTRPLLAVALLAVPTALALWPQPPGPFRRPADTFVPSISALAYYALFFALGATLSAHRDLVERAGETPGAGRRGRSRRRSRRGSSSHSTTPPPAPGSMSTWPRSSSSRWPAGPA